MKQTLLTAPRDPTMQHQNLGKPARHKHTQKRENSQKKLAERNNSKPIRYTAPKKRKEKLRLQTLFILAIGAPWPHSSS